MLYFLCRKNWFEKITFISRQCFIKGATEKYSKKYYVKKKEFLFYARMRPTFTVRRTTKNANKNCICVAPEALTSPPSCSSACPGFSSTAAVLSSELSGRTSPSPVEGSLVLAKSFPFRVVPSFSLEGCSTEQNAPENPSLHAQIPHEHLPLLEHTFWKTRGYRSPRKFHSTPSSPSFSW